MNKEILFVPKGTTLGEKLRSLRLQNKLSAKKVLKFLYVRKLKYSLQSFYKWEEDLTSPPLPVIHALASIYNSNFSYLIEEEEVNLIFLTKREREIIELLREDDLLHNIIMLIMRRIEFGR